MKTLNTPISESFVPLTPRRERFSVDESGDAALGAFFVVFATVIVAFVLFVSLGGF